MELINLVMPSVISIVAIIVVYCLGKFLGIISNNKPVMAVVSTIANNEQLRKIAKNLCVFAQKYVSENAMEKLKYVIARVEEYCKQSGLNITKEQVLEIVQTTYDQNKEEIKSNKFVQALETILKDNDATALKNN